MFDPAGESRFPHEVTLSPNPAERSVRTVPAPATPLSNCPPTRPILIFFQSRELEIAQNEVSRLSQELQALAEGTGAARNEQQRLQEELKSRAMEDAEGEGDGGGIGEGAARFVPVRSRGRCLGTSGWRLFARS